GALPRRVSQGPRDRDEPHRRPLPRIVNREPVSSLTRMRRRRREGNFVSITGYWIMAAVSPGAFNSLREDIDATQFDPVSDSADVEWWAAMDHAAVPAPGHRYQPGEAAVQFQEQLAILRPPDETIERCIDAFHHTV